MAHLSRFRANILLTQLSTRYVQANYCMYTSPSLSQEHDGHRKSNSAVYDVVICGGGMVGTSMACALGYNDMFRDKQILLLEGAPKKIMHSLPEKFANRTCSLSAGSIELLKSFGAWDNILNMRCQEVKRMQVWDGASDSLLTFNHPNMLENLAYVAENDVILKGITDQLDAIKARVQVRYESHVESYQLPSSGTAQADTTQLANVSLKNGDVVQAKLLIGADGFQSLLRRTAGIRVHSDDYKQTALVASLKLAEAMDNTTAWQRFLKQGPIALLPLSDQYCNLIWSTSPENAKKLMSLPDESFVDAVNNAFWSEEDKSELATKASRYLDTVLTSFGLDGSTSRQLPPSILSVDEGSRGTFPLTICHASQYVAQRMALIGDAAHRVHPLAGQGVNLGFGDVSCLRDVLTKAVGRGSDIGALSHLLAYETQRQRSVVFAMAVMDGLNRLYQWSWSPVVIARTLGLQVTNAAWPIKEKMIEFASR